MEALLKLAKEKMDKTVDLLEKDYQSMRVGRATPSIVEKISVDYYGASTPLNQMAAISVPDARTLLIQPWDASALKMIEKSISTSDIGINPQNDGKVIRLSFPQPTEERRKELAKDIHKNAEEAKVSVRSIRRDINEKYKALKKSNEITEDDLKDAEKDVQNMTDKYIKNIDEVFAKKEKEILEI